jgi:RNA polymerase sigma factor (sigma-70 family)
MMRVVSVSERAKDHINDLINVSALTIYRRFIGYVEYKDLIQELNIYVLQRPKLEEDLDESYTVSKDETKWVARKIMARFRRHIEKYSRKEKAAKVGYSTGDEFFYNTVTIASILPVALQFDVQGATLIDKVDDGQPRKSPAPNEGGNLMAMAIDVKSAVELLDKDEQYIIDLRYGASPMTLSDIAKELGLSDSTVDRRVQRILRKIIDHLGGPTPWA